MEDLLKILIVEDNPAISAVYRQFFEPEENKVLCANNYDQAIKILYEHPAMTFDLFFTDINLNGSSNKTDDKSGIAFARYVRQIFPKAAIAGHSAYFETDDISPEDKSLFDVFYPKAIKIAEREQMFEETLKIARTRKFKNQSKIPDRKHPDLAVPTEETGNIAEVAEDNVLDLDSNDLGYSMEIIYPNNEEEIYRHFSVWCRQSSSGCEMEVVGCPAILAWGETKKDAIEHLFEFIQFNQDLALRPDDKLGGACLDIAHFIRKIKIIKEVE